MIVYNLIKGMIREGIKLDRNNFLKNRYKKIKFMNP
jgi:hypothetical protein